MVKDEYIGISESAAILDVSVSTIRRLADTEKIKCYKDPHNNYRRFLKSDIYKFKNKIKRPQLGQLKLFEDSSEDVQIQHIRPKSHPKHYLMHKYWGRKPYNVISNYITQFTQPGDTVLDPFMGSAMVPIESIKNGRFGIGVDINPMSKFIGLNTVSKVDLGIYEETALNILKNLEEEYKFVYNTHCPECDLKITLENAIWDEGVLSRIKGTCPVHGTFVKDAEKIDIDLYNNISSLKNELDKKGIINYPNDEILRYVQRSGVKTLDNLFNDRALILLSKLKYHIDEIQDEDMRSLLNFTFTSMLPNVSKMLPGDKEKGTYKSGWVISKFWVPKIHTERNLFNCFKLRIKAIITGKKELQFINEELLTLVTQDSAKLSTIESETIDYIFTDPPYGESIAYLALSQLWNAWIKNDVNYEDEIIIDSYRNKMNEDYYSRMKRVFLELYRVLKDKHYLSFTFNNRDLNVWKAVMDAVKESGFHLKFIVYQNQAVTSGTQGINKKNTLTGDFIYTLYKDKNEKNIPSEKVEDSELFIKKTIKDIIKENLETTPTKLYEKLIPIIIEKDAYLDTAGKAIDIDKLLKENYEYIENSNSKSKLGEKFYWQEKMEN